MAQTVRPRRSMLYMPGANERALDKAKTLPADALILDLEDSVAPDAKEAARTLVADKVRARGYGRREILIRINAVSSPWGQADLEAAIAAGPDAVLVPKVEHADEVRALSRAIDRLGAPPGLRLWVMMETPLAMLRAEAIAAAAADTGSRLAGFVMGTNDLAKELYCAQTEDRLPMLASLSLCLLAARAYKLAIIDGVYNDLDNAEGFRRACLQGRDLGFDGKTVIHPRQIEPCNDIFKPSADDVSEARKIMAVFERPENSGKGVVSVDGRMVERLHADMARRVVELADAIAQSEEAA